MTLFPLIGWYDFIVSLFTLCMTLGHVGTGIVCVVVFFSVSICFVALLQRSLFNEPDFFRKTPYGLRHQILNHHNCTKSGVCLSIRSGVRLEVQGEKCIIMIYEIHLYENRKLCSFVEGEIFAIHYKVYLSGRTVNWRKLLKIDYKVMFLHLKIWKLCTSCNYLVKCDCIIILTWRQ